MAAAGKEPLPLKDAPKYEDKRNRKRASGEYGDYDGINLLPVFKGDKEAGDRTLFWRLQGVFPKEVKKYFLATISLWLRA